MRRTELGAGGCPDLEVVEEWERSDRGHLDLDGARPEGGVVGAHTPHESASVALCAFRSSFRGRATVGECCEGARCRGEGSCVGPRLSTGPSDEEGPE